MAKTDQRTMAGPAVIGWEMPDPVHDRSRTEECLLDGNEASDQAWFDEIYKKWFEEIARTAARSLSDHLRSDAEDIAVDAFERAWLKRHDRRFREQPRSWLHSTAQYLALNHNRLHEHRPRPELDESMSCNDGGIAAADFYNDLVAAVLRLKPRDRQLFWMVWSDERSTAEAAEMLKLTEAATRQALHRIHKKLRRWLTR